MDFMRSTQARSWMFDEISLENCRREAVRVVASPSYEGGDTSEYSAPRKFASGFHHRNSLKLENKPSDHARSDASNHLTISANEQEQLIRFHAQQIKPLVGPDAVLDELRKSEDVLLTAIMFFRRFFLSNTVVDIHPRRIAIACAFFASKVEEEPVTVSASFRMSLSCICRGRRHRRSAQQLQQACKYIDLIKIKCSAGVFREQLGVVSYKASYASLGTVQFVWAFDTLLTSDITDSWCF